MDQQTFDIDTGMAVFGANEQLIGIVAEIAGFGSTRISPASGSTGLPVTEAQSGTGYLRVKRGDGEDLYVPFHGIQEVVPGHGVTLTPTMGDELRRGVAPLTPQAEVTAQPQRRGWPLVQPRRWHLGQPRRWRVWRPRTWTVRRFAAKAAPVPGDGEGGTS